MNLENNNEDNLSKAGIVQANKNFHMTNKLKNLTVGNDSIRNS